LYKILILARRRWAALVDLFECVWPGLSWNVAAKTHIDYAAVGEHKVFFRAVLYIKLVRLNPEELTYPY
jgi:hypothetical protein